MSDQAQTSSITTVTEDEDSSVGWETDVTESSSSALSSNPTDYNTDDKLTPGLGNIFISKAADVSKPSCDISFSQKPTFKGKMKPPAVPVFPYGANPLSLHSNGNHQYENPKKRQKCSYNGAGVSENPDDSDLSESTSMNNSNNTYVNRSDVSCSETFENHTYSTGQFDDQRPFYPDMTVGWWYQARCFDNYWKNYHFVMDWYQSHLRTVQKITGGENSEFNDVSPHCINPVRQKVSSRRARKARASKRARNRRLTKERQRASSICKASTAASDATETMDSEPSGGEMEMEMTEEMVKFFTASFKHRIERDNQKKSDEKDEEENHVNIEEVVTGDQARSINAPKEQPGVRRTSELRLLYGSDAPMIHGMETALQLNFDRFTDKCQPKLWPNMPLKMCFG